MRNKKRNWKLLILSFLVFTAVYWLIFFTSPEKPLNIAGINIPTIPLLIFSVFLFLSLFFAFWLKNLRRGILFGIFGSVYLILSLLNVSHPFFVVVLIALLIVVELFFSRR